MFDFGKFSKAALVVLPFVVFSGSASADALMNGEAIGDWKFECLAVNEQQNRCALTQIIMLEASPDPLARISLTRGEDPTQVEISVLTPLAVLIEPGAALVIAEGGIELPFIACFAEGCLARKVVDGQELRDFLVMDEMAVVFSSVSIDGISQIPASARGLREALDRASFGIE